MKKHIHRLLLVMILSTNSLYALENDKLLHYGASTAAGYLSGSLLTHFHEYEDRSLELVGYSTLLGSLPGLAKEINDSTKEDNVFSNADMAANILGALTGALIHNYFYQKDFQVTVQTRDDRYLVSISHRF